MKISILKAKETLSVEEALNVKGGLRSSFDMVATECTCDCFISNKNEEKAKVAVPSNPIESIHE